MGLLMTTLYPPGTKAFNLSFDAYINLESTIKTPVIYANVSYKEYGSFDKVVDMLRGNEQEFAQITLNDLAYNYTEISDSNNGTGYYAIYDVRYSTKL
jgi:hypothetical protein